jgi:nucleotide-binding universal stress UspA family protein
VATDFSEHSTLAMKTAHSLKELNNKINLLAYHRYVVPMGWSKSGKSFEEFVKIMKWNAGEEMKSWIDDFKYEINPELTLQEDNSLATDIIDVADRNSVDLIVVGSKGLTKTSLALLGSNTLKMLKANDHIPMLVVKKEGENMKLLDALKAI